MKLRRSVDHQWECILSIQIMLHEMKNDLEDMRKELDWIHEREKGNNAKCAE